jgi:hypothetical protein
LIRIIDNQFRLNGSPVTSLALGSMGFDGSTLGFAAKTGQGWGIYRADFSRFGDMPGRDTFAGGAPSVPEPSTFLSMAIGAVGLVILRRRVKAKA